MRNYSYQRQDGNKSCGAACLSMIYGTLGIKYTQADIYSDLNIGFNTALNVADIIEHINKYAMLHACAIKFKNDNLEDLLNYINTSELHMIMSHTALNSNSAHFSVFSKYEDNQIFAFDPFNRSNFPISIETLKDLWKRNENASFALVAGEVAILASSDSSKFTTLNSSVCGHMIKRINITQRIVDSILCSECDLLQSPRWDQS